MITAEQQAILFQVNTYFSKIENMYSSQYLELFHTTWFDVDNRRDIFIHDQHNRSLEREKQFRSEAKFQSL
jgi:hypothetical protein